MFILLRADGRIEFLSSVCFCAWISHGLPDLGHLQVVVHMLQCPQALGQVLVVQLPVEVVSVLLAEPLGAEDVEPGALLHDGEGGEVGEVLLGDVLPDGPGDAPHVLVPVPHRLLAPLPLHHVELALGVAW